MKNAATSGGTRYARDHAGRIPGPSAWSASPQASATTGKPFGHPLHPMLTSYARLQAPATRAKTNVHPNQRAHSEDHHVVRAIAPTPVPGRQMFRRRHSRGTAAVATPVLATGIGTGLPTFAP
jgi:hypothetical protein